MSLIGRAARALAGIGIGKVTMTSDDGATGTGNSGPLGLQVDLARHLGLRDKVPLLQHFGFTSRPPVGSDVLAVFPNAERTRW